MTEATPIGDQAQAAVASAPGAQEVATRAKAWLAKAASLFDAAQKDLEKYVPAEAVNPIVAEVESLVKGIL